MIDFLRLLYGALIGLFRSSAPREAEILIVRHQINVLRRKAPQPPALNNVDHLLLVWLSRLVRTTLAALTVVTPKTVIRWQRGGFRRYSRWKSTSCGGWPTVPLAAFFVCRSSAHCIVSTFGFDLRQGQRLMA